MALPPEQIRLKRKADDEPVNVLLIHNENTSKRHLSHRNVTEQGFTFVRVQTTVYASSTRSVSVGGGAQVPHVRSTLVPDDAAWGSAKPPPVPLVRSTLSTDSGALGIAKPPQGIADLPASNNPSLFQHGLHSLSRDNPERKRRRFHLTREASPWSWQHQSSPGVRNRKKQRRNLAVFAEKAVAEYKKQGQQHGGEVHSHEIDVQPADNADMDLDHPADLSQHSDSKPHKRPNATAAERKWRDENWKTKAVDKNVEMGVEDAAIKGFADSQQNYNALQVASSLQDMIQREIETPKLKYQPKAVPRHAVSTVGTLIPADSKDGVVAAENQDLEIGNAGMDKLHPEVKEEDWVYDTYLRQAHAGGEQDEVGGESVGLLVITAEDQEAWEGFHEEEGSEEETDEEDENAEDFYANDYPEEELDSEDEAGGRAYTFQNGEEEEWGIGSGDEEDLGVGMGVGVGVAVDWKGRVLKNAEEVD